MSPNNNKLELTWVGKYDEQKPVEPRILIEDPKYSYGTVETGVLPNGKPWNGNMLIHGDNLLALKALEQDFSGSIKCIYIDPPYQNTQQYGYSFNIYELETRIWNNVPIYISEGIEMERAKKTYLLSSGRTKGNINGKTKKKPVEEWLNKYVYE